MIDIGPLFDAGFAAGQDSASGEIMRLREALAFAASVIKSGEPWTDHCEEVIGSVLSRFDTGQSDG